MFGSCTERKKGKEGSLLLVVKVIASGEGGHIYFSRIIQYFKRREKIPHECNMHTNVFNYIINLLNNLC